MSKYTEIHPDGQRAYQFVADTAYVRESGTKGEHKAAEYILKEVEQASAQPGRSAYIQTPRMEFFQCPDFQQKKLEFSLQGSGRVCGIVVLVNGLQLFFDKNIQFILKNRKKEA